MACVYSNREGGGSPGLPIGLAPIAPVEWQIHAEYQLGNFMPPTLQAQLPTWARNYLLAQLKARHPYS